MTVDAAERLDEMKIILEPSARIERMRFRDDEELVGGAERAH